MIKTETVRPFSILLLIAACAAPLLAQSLDEPSAYEVLADAAPGGTVVVSASDRA